MFSFNAKQNHYFQRNKWLSINEVYNHFELLVFFFIIYKLNKEWVFPKLFSSLISEVIQSSSIFSFNYFFIINFN